MKIETQAIHAGGGTDPATGAVIPPIYLSTTYERHADGTYPQGYDYTRADNPNRHALESALAQLEGGAAALAFASGSVATMTVLQALAAGDHVIAPEDIYYGIRLILTEILSAWGLQTTFVDMTDPDAVQAALRPNTKLILTESPSNPQIKITDIAAIAAIAHQAGALLLCDNTIATPILQNPLALGADLVVHATTKYISGHSDVLGGAVVIREENAFFERLKLLQKVGGAVPSPFDCWLTLRGLQTLPYRVRAHAANAQKIAAFLQNHPAVERVLYPGLPSHPQHHIAQKQMSAYGGLLSILVKGDAQRAMDVAAKVRVFTRATSFGGTHSLIEHRASIEAPGSPTPQNLLRLAIGLENADDLMADLDAALQ